MAPKKDVENWPPVAGRYIIGNKKSPVAVCTLSTIEMNLDMTNIAITGKCVIENIGIEKVVKNIVANANIRFLILCGKEPLGHYTGQAIKCLLENGVDENKKIIGALGAMPYLKNLSTEEMDRFKRQIKIIDLIGVEDPEIIMNSVNDCLQRDPGSYESGIELPKTKTIVAWHDDESEWSLDPLGFFTISIKRDTQEIVVEYYSIDKVLKTIIIGKNAEELSHTIIRECALSKADHAAYLGRELEKAEIAMKNNLDYEQEKELFINKQKESVSNEKEEIIEREIVDEIKASEEILREEMKIENKINKKDDGLDRDSVKFKNMSEQDEKKFRNLLKKIRLI